ncbi:hypothetical protein [Nocardia sp. SC052]
MNPHVPQPESWLGLLADLARVGAVLLLGVLVFLLVTVGLPL